MLFLDLRCIAIVSLALVLIATLDVRLVDARPTVWSAWTKRLDQRSPFGNDDLRTRRGAVASRFSTRTPRQRRRQVSSDAFCQAFAQDCYNTALQGKQPGQVTLTRSCQRAGSSKTPSYSFGCKADGRDLTQAVLNAMGNRITVTVPTTATQVNVQRVVATAYQEQVIPLTAVQPVTVTATQRVALTSIVQQFIPQTLILPTTTTALQRLTLTSVVNQIVSKTTILPAVTSLVQNVVTVAGSVGAATTTRVLFGNYSVPIVQLNIRSAEASSLQRRANTPFCSTFTASCKTACSSARSSASTNTCSQKSSTSYALTCYCRSRKSVVDAALANVAAKFALPAQAFQTVAVVTNVAYATDTVTQVVNVQKVVATVNPVVTIGVTATAIVPVTVATTVVVATTRPVATAATTSTATVTTTSTQTTVVATSQPVVTASTTITSVVPQSATSTTEIILTPTGRVGIRTTDGLTDGGFLAPAQPPDFFTSSAVYPYNAATVFMAVRDATSDAFQLRVTDGTGDELAIEVGFGSDAQGFQAGSPSFGFAERVPVGTCGTADVRAGVADGYGSTYGNPCASYVFVPTFINGTKSNTVRLQSRWYNAGNTAVSPQWTFEQNAYALGLTGDPDAFAVASGGEGVYPVDLTFPL